MEKPLLIIRGIPETLHVPDLRVFFEPAIEQGLFACFHFRRGKEKQPRLACQVRAVSKEAAGEIIRSFHNVPWREVLIDAPISNAELCLVNDAVGGKADTWELDPPAALPQGNVGTCRAAVLGAIRSCRLPASVIKRLGIVPSKVRSTRSSATIPPPLCWREAMEASACEGQTSGTKEEEKQKTEQKKEQEGPKSFTAALFASLKRPAKAKAQASIEDRPKRQKLSASTTNPKRMCVAFSEEESEASDAAAEKGVEGRHLSRPLDTEPDDFDEPLEKAPHYERSDRLDSAAGYLYEDTVENIWDKQDASGLVWYTDAAFWDRMAGDLDERCADGWDVEGESDESSSPGSPHAIRALEQGTGLAAVRRGVAGQIMRSWGGCPSAAPSSTFLAVVEGQQPNTARTGLGWDGERRRSRPTRSVDSGSDWCRIGSAYDARGKAKSTGSFVPPISGSFSAASLYFAEDRRKRIDFVPAAQPESVSLKTLQASGKKTLIWFYPKAQAAMYLASGFQTMRFSFPLLCEALSFSAAMGVAEKRWAVLIGADGKVEKPGA
ncbi:unnamed protein product [Effrenium voratum]|uniref:RRM domain-containing protein n=1 Tax=Effrenium voratum TaxID=2562239 RepID=A0AA36JQ95_9DINO|nr:unnamed protein product [Effrenium voratum]